VRPGEHARHILAAGCTCVFVVSRHIDYAQDAVLGTKRLFELKL
jgi:hypothetical protein